MGVAMVISIAGLVVIVGPHCVRPRLQIRGYLSKDDLAGILRAHRTRCPERLPITNPTWFPTSVRRYVSAQLNPIEIISVPADGRAIVVYRGFYHFYYDEKGKHRWGTATYTLNRNQNVWR